MEGALWKRNDFEFEVFLGLRFVTNVPTAFDSWLVELGNVYCEWMEWIVVVFRLSSWILIVQFFEYYCKNPYLPFSCLQIFEIRAPLFLQLSWKWDLYRKSSCGRLRSTQRHIPIGPFCDAFPSPNRSNTQCEKGTGTKYYQGWSSTLSRIYGIANHVGREHITNKFCIRRTSIGKLKMQMY